MFLLYSSFCQQCEKSELHNCRLTSLLGSLSFVRSCPNVELTILVDLIIIPSNRRRLKLTFGPSAIFIAMRSFIMTLMSLKADKSELLQCYSVRYWITCGVWVWSVHYNREE